MMRSCRIKTLGLLLFLPVLAFGRGEGWVPKPPVPPPVGTLTNEARYIEWKWREDVTDPKTGVTQEQAKERLLALSKELEPKEPWNVVKAECFAWLCDNLAVDLSPTMGVDTEGVTALISTLGSLDSRDFPGDFPLDVMLLPHAVSGDKGLEVMKALVFQYYENGGLLIQFNVFDAEELKDAQKHPEKYENLQVRVCGWNVRWNDLPKVEQDAYIRRAEEIACRSE